MSVHGMMRARPTNTERNTRRPPEKASPAKSIWSIANIANATNQCRPALSQNCTKPLRDGEAAAGAAAAAAMREGRCSSDGRCSRPGVAFGAWKFAWAERPYLGSCVEADIGYLFDVKRFVTHVWIDLPDKVGVR